MKNAKKNQVEEALRESEHHYRLLVEQSPNTVIIHCDGKIVYINPAGVTLLGVSSEQEIIGKPAIGFVHPDDRAAVVKRITDALVTGNPTPRSEERFILPDGRMIYVDVIGIPITYKGKPAMEVLIRDISDRKETEKALKSSEARLSAFLEFMPALILIKDHELRPVFANNKFASSFPVKEWLGRTPHELFPQGVADQMVAKDTEALNAGYTSYEESWKDINGNLHTYFTEKFRIEIPDGAPLLGSIITDITGKKKVENALLESDEIFARFMDRSPIYVFFKDEHIRSLRLSRNYEDMLGRPLDELLGKSMDDLFPSDLAKKMVEDDIRVLKEGKEVVLEEEFNGRSYTTIKFPIHINGKPRFLAGFTMDITDRKQAEAELELREKTLRIAEHRARVLIENAPDGIVMISREGRCLYASPPAMRMFGYSFEEYSPLNPDDLTHPGDLPMVHETLGRLLQDPALVPTIQYRYRHKNGNWVWIESTFSNLLNTPGIEAIVINFRDVTDKKRAVDELLKAKEKAEQSDRLKSTFLANMSHEIRTPMNAIVGFAGMLSDPEFSDEDRKRFSDIIQSRSNDLMHLINDLLEISRIESGNATLTKEKVSLNALIDDLKSVFGERLQRRTKPTMTLHVEKGLSDLQSIITTDTFIIRQVFSNLLDNAIKYSDSGSIRFGYHRPENGIITCFVADTGIGISRENQTIIFEHFRQADSKYPHKYGGTGLGLSICKGSLALLEGEIRVESEPGKGSTFFFTFPYEPASDPTQPVGSRDDELPAEKIDYWPDKKILLVEDDPINMEFLEIILKSTHAQVVKVFSGRELKTFYPKLGSFDIVLLDVRLPDANGWELVKEIKAIRPELPVIAQTAYAMSVDRTKSLESGCDEYLSKPISKEQLLGMLEGYLNPNSEIVR